VWALTATSEVNDVRRDAKVGGQPPHIIGVACDNRVWCVGAARDRAEVRVRHGVSRIQWADSPLVVPCRVGSGQQPVAAINPSAARAATDHAAGLEVAACWSTASRAGMASSSEMSRAGTVRRHTDREVGRTNSISVSAAVAGRRAPGHLAAPGRPERTQPRLRASMPCGRLGQRATPGGPAAGACGRAFGPRGCPVPRRLSRCRPCRRLSPLFATEVARVRELGGRRYRPVPRWDRQIDRPTGCGDYRSLSAGFGCMFERR